MFYRYLLRFGFHLGAMLEPKADLIRKKSSENGMAASENGSEYDLGFPNRLGTFWPRSWKVLGSIFGGLGLKFQPL